MRRPSRAGTGRKAEAGAATLPLVVTAAVVVALVQVPLFYKTNASNKFSGEQKNAIMARNLAEAAVDQVITDIGQKRIRVSSQTDTMPYNQVALGQGKYSAHLSADDNRVDTVNVRAEGQVQKDKRTIEARLQIIRTVTDIPYDTPKLSLWGVDGTPPTIRYYSLDEKARGVSWVHLEGRLDLGAVTTVNVDDYTVANDGIMYFINNVGNSTLYKVRSIDLDNNPSTPVMARLVGSTNLLAGSADEIRGMIFINGTLFVATKTSKKIYELNIENGAASPVCSLTVGGTFQVDAMTQGHDGTIYLSRTNTTATEIWRFDNFLGGVVSRAVSVNDGSGQIRSLAAHPDGYLYGTDNSKWYKINPGNGSYSQLFVYNCQLKGMGYHFEREKLKFDGTPLSHKRHVCHFPPGNNANFHTLSVSVNAVNAHVNNHGGDYLGYCGLPFVDPLAFVQDTTVRVKVLAWKETGEKVVSPNDAGVH